MLADPVQINVNEKIKLAEEWKFLPFNAQAQNKKDGEAVYRMPGFTSEENQRNILFTPVEGSHFRSSSAGYELFHVNNDLHSEILQAKPTNLSISFVFEGKVMDVELERHNVFSENARFYHGTHDNKIPFDYIPGVHYRSAKSIDQTILVAISFFEDDIIGILDDGLGPVDLGYMDNNYRARNASFAMRRAEEVFRNLPFECEVKEPPNYIQDQESDRHQPDVRSSNLCFEQYVEADHHLYKEKGNSVQQSINFISGLYNQVMGLYSNEGITLVLSEVMVWSSPDPYNSNSFNAFSSAMSNGFNGDLAHLVSRNPNQSGGVAWLSTVCNSNSYYKTAFSKVNSSYSNIPTYSWSVSVITHELGHNLGSQHTQACAWNGNNTAIDGCYNPEGSCAKPGLPTNGGTIMSYCHLLSGVGINFNNGFGTQPGNRIRSVLGNCSDCTTSTACSEEFIYVSSTPANNPVSAISEIISDWDINPNQNPQTIIFKAGESITLMDGFHARAGSSFRAYIEACGSFLLLNQDNTQVVLPEEITESVSVSNKPRLSIMPNISSTETTIEMTTYDDQEFQLFVINQNGQTVRTLLNGVNLSAGIHNFSLRLDQFNAGMYYITMISRSGIQTERLVVVKY